MQKKELYVVPVPVLDTYALTVCALLTALSVVLARLLTIIPSEVSRFSLEAVPILLAGLLFGPLPGAAVGFAADFIGCLFPPLATTRSFACRPFCTACGRGWCAGMSGAGLPSGGRRWRYFLRRYAAPCSGRAWLWRWCTVVRPNGPIFSPGWRPAAFSSPSPAVSTRCWCGC